MEITKEYKFYYGHRNQELNDKCFRPHGHHAKVFITFKVKRNGSISTLFNDFDSLIEPWFKEKFDHRFAIDINDPLLPYLEKFEKDRGESLGLNILPYATSVENMCYHIFKHLVEEFKFDVLEIKYQETVSSTITYNQEDYLSDKELFETDEEEEFQFASLFEFLGFSAGQAVGRAVYDEAVRQGVIINSQDLPKGKGFKEVKVYPVSFLKSFFRSEE